MRGSGTCIPDDTGCTTTDPTDATDPAEAAGSDPDSADAAVRGGVVRGGVVRGSEALCSVLDLPVRPAFSYVDPELDVVPADGATTSTIRVMVFAESGAPVPGAHLQLDVHPAVVGGGNNPGALSTGDCGSFTDSEGVTDSDGTAYFVYTASLDDVMCNISSLVNEGGFTDFAVVYQGTAARFQPEMTGTAPLLVVPGGAPSTFTSAVTNTAPGFLDNIVYTFMLAGDWSETSLVRPDQVHLEVAGDATDGQFVPVSMLWSAQYPGTLFNNFSDGDRGTFPRGATHRLTYRVALDASVPDSAVTGNPLQVVTEIRQMNPANGASKYLQHDGPYDIPVGPAVLGAPAFATTAVDAEVHVGTHFSTVVRVSSHPTAALDAVGLPGGMVFEDRHDGTGVLSGSPSAVGRYAVTVTARNGVGLGAQQVERLVVVSARAVEPIAVTVAPTAVPSSDQSPTDAAEPTWTPQSAPVPSQGQSDAAGTRPDVQSASDVPGFPTSEATTSGDPGRLSLKVTARPAVITAGQAATITVSGTPGDAVELRAYSRPSSTYRTVRRGVLGATGTLAFSVVPSTNTRLFASRAELPALASSTTVLHVRSALTLAVERGADAHLTFSGVVTPKRIGDLVTVYWLDRQGVRHLLAQSRTDARGSYRLRRTWSGAGTTSFVVRSGQTLTNASGESATARAMPSRRRATTTAAG